jgi:hypothetical protein
VDCSKGWFLYIVNRVLRDPDEGIAAWRLSFGPRVGWQAPLLGLGWQQPRANNTCVPYVWVTASWLREFKQYGVEHRWSAARRMPQGTASTTAALPRPVTVHEPNE